MYVYVYTSKICIYTHKKHIHLLKCMYLHQEHTHTHTCVNTYINVYINVCVFVFYTQVCAHVPMCV